MLYASNGPNKKRYIEKSIAFCFVLPKVKLGKMCYFTIFTVRWTNPLILTFKLSLVYVCQVEKGKNTKQSLVTYSFHTLLHKENLTLLWNYFSELLKYEYNNFTLIKLIPETRALNLKRYCPSCRNFGHRCQSSLAPVPEREGWWFFGPSANLPWCQFIFLSLVLNSLEQKSLNRKIPILFNNLTQKQK